MHVRRPLVVATVALALAATSGVSTAAPPDHADERPLPRAPYAQAPVDRAGEQGRTPAPIRPGPSAHGARMPMALQGGSVYVDDCRGTTGDAVDIRRTTLAVDDQIAQFTLRTCDPAALEDVEGQKVRWVAGGAQLLVERKGDGWHLNGTAAPSVFLHRPPDAPGVVQLVVQVDVDDVVPASCKLDRASSSPCISVRVESFGTDDDSTDVPQDEMPDASAPPMLWPSSCRADVDPARADRARVTAASTEGAGHVADRLRAAGYVVARHDDAPVVEVLAGATDEVRAALATWDDVEVVEDAAVRQLARTPNDPHLDAQWYLDRVGAPDAWDEQTGSSRVAIAVVDNGVAAGRTDLDRGRVLGGWDALRGQPLPAGEHSDLGGHGTAVAALAAARTNEGAGIAGVSWDAGIVPVRVFDHAGCFVSEAAYKRALRWIADQPRGAVDVANFSLGGGRIDGEDELIRAMVANGTTVVAASGNEGDRTGLAASFPAALPDVVAVGATLRDDTLAAYSNRGRHVDVVAPGGLERSGATAAEAILAPADPVVVGPDDPYAPLAGTSFATPLVAGAAALYLAEHAGATPADVTRALLTTARDLGEDLAGFDVAYGFGMVDAAAALAHAPGQQVARVEGLDRYETAARASRRAFRDPALVDTVLLATGENYPDALAGGPLAARENAPVLLTPRDGLHPATSLELTRLLPDGGTVLLLGGPAAVSDAVVEQLRGLDLQPRRVSGHDRYATAATIALGDGQSTWRAWGRSDLVHLATGENFPDALPGGAAAAALDAPLLLTAQGFLPGPTREAVARLGASQVVVLGGPNAVSDAVVDELRRMGIRVYRAAGQDRYETAVAALCPAAHLCQTDTRFAVVATGEHFADALGGSAVAAALRAPLLLVPRAGVLPSIVGEALDVLQAEQAVVLGGPAAIAGEMADQVGSRVVR